MLSIPLSYRVHIWCGKTRMAGLQSGEGRMMIDSVVWARYINVTDTQTDTQRDTHTDSHVAIANVAPTHCVGRLLTVFNKNRISTVTIHTQQQPLFSVSHLPSCQYAFLLPQPNHQELAVRNRTPSLACVRYV